MEINVLNFFQLPVSFFFLVVYRRIQHSPWHIHILVQQVDLTFSVRICDIGKFARKIIFFSFFFHWNLFLENSLPMCCTKCKDAAIIYPLPILANFLKNRTSREPPVGNRCALTRTILFRVPWFKKKKTYLKLADRIGVSFHRHIFAFHLVCVKQPQTAKVLTNR